MAGHFPAVLEVTEPGKPVKLGLCRFPVLASPARCTSFDWFDLVPKKLHRHLSGVTSSGGN